jgi:hypothetical protein
MRQLSSFAPGRFIAGLTLMALLLLLSVPRTAPAVA